METTPSFAPLAARLAAHAAGLRAVDGARDTVAEFAALVMCALLDMLIYLCETLDARAAAGIRPVEALASRRREPASVPPSHAGRRALPGERRARAASPPPVAQAVVPTLKAAASASGGSTQGGLWLAGSRDADPLWAVRAPVRRPPPENAAFPPASTHAQFVTI